MGVTDQLVHQHVAKDRYLQTSQMLETEVGPHMEHPNMLAAKDWSPDDRCQNP